MLVHDPVLAIANVMQEYLCDVLWQLNVPAVRCCLAQGVPPPMDDCCVIVGPGDEPDRNGFAWVTVGQVYPVGDTFPAVLARVEKCPQGLAQQYTLGIYRCAPSMGDKGKPPPCEEVEEAVLRQTQDGVILRKVIRCSLAAAGKPFMLQTGGPVHPTGGCMGWSQQVLVHLEDCITCAVESS